MVDGWIDYWCNDFRPEKQDLWRRAIRSQDIPLRLRGGEDDAPAAPDEFMRRMDEVGVKSVLLPSASVPELAEANAYERFATPPEDVFRLAEMYSGRFAGLVSIDPTRGQQGVVAAAQCLSGPAFVGLHLHTHSWDRPFDHRDLYPFYALAADHDVPVIVQAGTSGGLMASACGQPIGIDRPALYFPGVRFVLSHTGWPWVDEAIAMASKHPNVFLGTAAFPANHWPESLIEFVGRAGRGKVLLGTSFPVVGHRQALDRVAKLDLSDEAYSALLHGAAKKVFRNWPDLAMSNDQEENPA